MKLKFPSKRNSVPERQPKLGQSLPIDRYYSSMSLQKRSDANTKRDTLRKTDRSIAIRKQRAASWMVTMLRWAGVVGIVCVLLINTTLNRVGVKIGYGTASGNGVKYRSDQQYIEQAEAVFRKNPFYRGKFTFSATSYELLLAESMPEVEASVAVVPLVGTKLQVGLTITEPLAHIAVHTGQNMIVGTNGKLLEVTDKSVLNGLIASSPELRIDTAGTLEVGSAVLTSNEVKLMQLLREEFDGSHISRPKLQRLQYIVEKREVHVYFAGKPFFVKFTTERDSRLQAGTLVATLREMYEGQGVVEPSQYIDVRVEGRVFVL